MTPADDPPHDPPVRKLSTRERIEDRVATLGVACFRHPLRTLGIFFLIVAALGSQLPKTYFETDVELHLAPDNPVRRNYEFLREQFGRSDYAMVVMTPPEVFTPEFLMTLRELHGRFEDELPWIDEVQSLVNARFTRGEDDTLVVGDLLDDWPETTGEIDVLRQFVLANPFYRNLYISSDGRTVGIVIRPLVYEPNELDEFAGFDDDVPTGDSATERSKPEFLKDARVAELLVSLQSIVASFDLEGIEVHIAGDPVVNTALQTQVASDMARHSLYAFGAIALLLALVFRRVSAVLLPLLLVGLSLIAALGAMAAVGRPLTFVSQVIPSFILAVGVGFAVHVLAIFYQRVDAGDEIPDAVDGALRHTGAAIAMSSLTTAGGMLSFVAADLVSIRDIGIFVPFSALFSAALSLFALPALLAFTPVRARPHSSQTDTPLTERVLITCGLFATRHPIPIVITAFAILGVAVLGIPRIHDEYDFLKWFAPGNTAATATRYVDKTLGGASSAEILFDTGRENGLHDPEVLRRIESIQRYAETHGSHRIQIQKTISIVDVVKEIHQALNGGHPSAYTIADDRKLIAQELLLFENSGSDDLEDIVDSQFRMARITLKSNLAAGNYYQHYLDAHTPALRELAGDAELSFTGYLVLGANVSTLTSSTALRSYALAFLLVTPLMMLFIGSLRIGLISMAPNLMPILMVMGTMGWIGAPLDMLGSLIGGIALGLVVDDTIHILHGFRRTYEQTGDVEESTRQVMQTTGRALLFTTAVLAAAFLVFSFAHAEPLSNFGRLTALAIVLAFVFDVLLSPALLALLYRRR